MIVNKQGGNWPQYVLNIQAYRTLCLFGTEHLPEERYIDWNFLASEKSLITEAKQQWIDQNFLTTQGEELEYIPYTSLPNSNQSPHLKRK